MVSYIVIGNKTPIPIPELELAFCCVIGIGEHVIGIFNYFSIIFSVTSCNFITQIVCYKYILFYKMQ